MTGQVTWESRGYGTNDYVVEVETSKNIHKQYRFASNFGKLSRPMKSETVGQGESARTLDVGQSSCIWAKTIKTGDEVRFTLEQNMDGTPTYGDAEVKVGNYLAYLHENVILNKLDTPAVPVQGEMSQHRIKAVIGDPESRIRSEISKYLAEQYVYDVLEGHFRGASRNLMADRSLGGRAIDLDLGAGVQVSPENFLVKGDGFVSGTSGTAAYETSLETALATLGATDLVDRAYMHTIRDALTSKKIAPTTMGEARDKWYVAVDPDLMRRMTAPAGALATLWASSRERSTSNPVFGHGSVELDDMIFFPEQRLKQFRPVLSNPGIAWGTNSENRRNFTTSSVMCLMVVLGNGALLEGNDGMVDITYEKGFHGKGATISGHIKEAFMRGRWKDKDGRSTAVRLNQSSMTIAFYDAGPTY